MEVVFSVTEYFSTIELLEHDLESISVNISAGEIINPALPETRVNGEMAFTYVISTPADIVITLPNEDWIYNKYKETVNNRTLHYITSTWDMLTVEIVGNYSILDMDDNDDPFTTASHITIKARPTEDK